MRALNSRTRRYLSRSYSISDYRSPISATLRSSSAMRYISPVLSISFNTDLLTDLNSLRHSLKMRLRFGNINRNHLFILDL